MLIKTCLNLLGFPAVLKELLDFSMEHIKFENVPLMLLMGGFWIGVGFIVLRPYYNKKPDFNRFPKIF